MWEHGLAQTFRQHAESTPTLIGDDFHHGAGILEDYGDGELFLDQQRPGRIGDVQIRSGAEYGTGHSRPGEDLLDLILSIRIQAIEAVRLIGDEHSFNSGILDQELIDCPKLIDYFPVNQHLVTHVTPENHMGTGRDMLAEDHQMSGCDAHPALLDWLAVAPD